MCSLLRRFAAAFLLFGSTALAQLVTTNLVLEFNAGTDLQGDALWTDTAGALATPQTLTFAGSPLRMAIDTGGSTYPALSVGYATVAHGLNGFFDTGSPVRSTTSGTFELWVNVTSLAAGSDQVIFEAGGADSGLSFVLSGDTLAFNVDGALTSDLTITKPLTVGLHHVVGVITNSNDSTANDSLALYVDGTLVQTIAAVNINDWAGGNISAIGGTGLATNSITGVAAPISFHGQVAALRYYSRALTAAQVAQNNAHFRQRVATYVTGVSSTNNYAVTSDTGFAPTKTRTIGGVLYGFNHVISDGTDGLVATQFIRWDLYTSPDNGSTWSFVRTLIDNTHPSLTNTIFQSIQFQVTPAGCVGLYMKNLYAVKPAGTADNRKFLTCIFGETPASPFRVAFDERPFGEESGDLGSITTGGQLYIVSANTTDGYINIFNVGARGDTLVGHTLRKQWLLPDNSIDYREAPSLFFQSGYWFLTTSGRTGWRPNQHKYAYARSLAGPWSALIDLGDATGYHSQLFFTATAGANRIFSATRNAPQWGGEGGSDAVWLPLRFNRVPDGLATNYYDEVEINYTAGTVEGFHYDRGRQLPVTRAKLVGAADDISAIVDGNETTSWSNNNVATKRTVDLELGSAQLVKALKIKPLDEWRWTYKVKIYVGDGTTFTQVFPKGAEAPIIPNYAFLGPIAVTPTTGSVIRIENYASYQEGATNNRFGLYEVQVWGGTANAGAELSEAFATYPANWVTSAQTGTSAGVVTLPGDATPSLKLTDGSASSRVEVSKSFSAQNGSRVVAEMKYRTDRAGSGEFIRLSGAGAIALNLVNSPTTIPADPAFATLAMTDNTGAETALQPISVGAWHFLRLEVNTDTDTFDLYIDGQLAWLGGKLRNAVNGLDKFMFGTTAGAVNVAAYLDDLAIDGPNPAGNTTVLDQTEQLQQQVIDLQDQLAAQQATLTTLQTQYAALQANYTTLQASYANLDTQNQARAAEITTLQAALTVARAETDAARASLALAQAEVTRLLAALTASQADVTTLRAALATAQAEAATLRTSLTAAQAEVATLRTALGAAQADAAALRASLTEAQATLQTLRTSLQAATAQVATLTAEKAQLGAALAQSAASNQVLSGQVAAMNATLAAIADVLGKDNGNAAFTLPGATPEARLEALRQAIGTLNHGQKQALYKALGGK